MASEAVRVIVRCRPENSREKALKCKKAVDVDEDRNQIILKNAVGSVSGKQDKPFTFDGSYKQLKTNILINFVTQPRKLTFSTVFTDLTLKPQQSTPNLPLHSSNL